MVRDRADLARREDFDRLARREAFDRVARRAAEQPERGGPQPDLGGGLFARGVQDVRACRARDARRDLEEQGGLADPGLAADEDERPGHEAATEDAIELA